MKIRRVSLNNDYVFLIFYFSFKWSGNIFLPKATFFGIKGLSNKYNNFTYRLDLSSVKIKFKL